MIPSRLRRAWQLWSVLVLIAVLCIPSLVVNGRIARADDSTVESSSTTPGADTSEAAPTGGPTFSLYDMGRTSALSMYGSGGSADLTVPVPRGLKPAALKATVERPVGIRAGILTVMQKDRTIARLPLPAKDLTSVTIPLSGATIDDNAIKVTVRASLEPDEGFCLDPNSPLRLVDGMVSFTGTETAPKNVAEFLPPILRKLIIAIPKEPSKAESDAAVRLAAAVVARYGQQPTAIALTALDSAKAPAGPFERRIVIQGGDEAGLALRPVPGGLPNLAITGPDGEITNQARLLSSDLSQLALSSKAVVGPISDRPVFPGDVTTLRALGQSMVSSVAVSPQAQLGIDQTRLGRPVKGVRVHLKGSYSPVPHSVSAQLVANVGGEFIDSWAVDDIGRIDHWVDIPDRLLQRYTTLAVELDVIGNAGRCGEFQPLTLTIDGSTVIESAAAVPPLPAGLQSLPQAWMPRALIGIGPKAFADTARATSLVVSMQRLSVLPIDVSVTSVDEALKSKLPAIIISADGWDHPEIVLPVSTDNGKLRLDAVLTKGNEGDEKKTTLTVTPELKYGTVQTMWQGGRSLLVATSNGAPRQLDDLLRWISDDQERFSTLDGIAVVAVPGEAPVVVGPQLNLAGPETTGMPLWKLAAAAVVAIAMAAAIVWFLRSRRVRPVGSGDD